MPLTVGEILRPTACEASMPTFQYVAHVPPLVTTCPQATVTFSAPIVHTTQQDYEPVFHLGSVGAYDRGG